jgi:aspartate/methionine/tyrosine aminotransferase
MSHGLSKRGIRCVAPALPYWQRHALGASDLWVAGEPPTSAAIVDTSDKQSATSVGAVASAATSDPMAAAGHTALQEEVKGYVLLDIAENNIQFPIIQTQLRSCRSDTNTKIGRYTSMLGWMPLRVAIARLYSQLLDLQSGIDPEHIVVSAGCGALIQNLCMTLLDPGDSVLLPTPVSVRHSMMCSM